MYELVNVKSTRQILILDSLRYSIELERKAYSSLKRNLAKIELTEQGYHPKNINVLNAFSSAWLMIDTIHRVRGLVGQVQGLSQKSSELQVFKRSTSTVENFRNLYQHLNSEIPKFNGPTNPIMGVISWVTKDPNNSISVYLGTGSDEIELHSLPINSHQWSFLQSILFSAGNRDVELDKIHLQTLKLSKHLNSWLKKQNMLTNKILKPSIYRFNLSKRPNEY